MKTPMNRGPKPSRRPSGQSPRNRPDLRGKHRIPEKIFPFPEADDRIFDMFRHHGFGDYPHEKRHQLVRFYELLMQHQMKDNITRLIKIRDVALKHFVDCLLVPKLTKLTFPLLDIGTGAGFPGIPLKVHFPEQRIILAEGVGKRVEFLKSVRSKMELRNLDIIGRYVDSKFEYPVECAITRAVADISDTLGQVKGCLSSGKRMIFMKGPHVGEEIKRWKEKRDSHFQLVEDIPYELPNSPHRRRLVIFERV